MKHSRFYLMLALLPAIAFAPACLPEDSTENYPTPEMLKPVPLAPRAERVPTPEEQQNARQREFRELFSQEMQAALDTMDWGPLPEGEQPSFNYNLQDAYSCPVSYVVNLRLKEENDIAGIATVVLRETFQLEFKKSGKASEAVLTPESFTGLLSVPSQKISVSGIFSNIHPQKFNPQAPDTLFSKKFSPVFWSNTANAYEYAERPFYSSKKYPPTATVSLFNFFPPMPEASPGATAEWHYSPLYDENKPSDMRPAGKVHFVTWFKLQGKNAALLKVSWPSDEQDWISSDDLLFFKIKNKKDSSVSLKQTESPRAEFIVSESGETLLARFHGIAKGKAEITTNSRLQRTTIHRRTGRISSHDQPQKISYEEQIYYDFFLRNLRNCSGSMIKLPDPEVLDPEALKSLTQKFFSLYLIGRKGEALELLSPEIRAHISDDYLKYFFDIHLSEVGEGLLGTPMSPVAIQEDNPIMRKSGTGYLWEGIYQKKKKNTYSLSRGILLSGKPYLTFIGISSKPSRSNWDIMQLSTDEKMALSSGLAKFPHIGRPKINTMSPQTPPGPNVPPQFGPKSKIQNVRRR